MSLSQRKAAHHALKREQELMKAIEERGYQEHMSIDRIRKVKIAAQEEIRRRGMAYDQILGDLPANPTECCGDCYDDLMNR